ncbi:MAG: hypothetical protein LBS45_03745 [Synergistaceae bacterium]|jgi:curli biogenesis system outer membrane secretion channel CsgG/TolA-binding protein|nr:hypothetical protein [Synergistaceae bacterium]
MKKSDKNKIFSAVLAAVLFITAQANVACAGEKIRVGIAPFANKADWLSGQQVSIITDLFTFELAQSKSISVSEREQIQKIGEELKFGMSGLVDPSTAAEVGRIMGLQYMLLGSVTQVDRKNSGGAAGGGARFFGVGIGGSSEELKATIDMRVVDVATAEIKLALRAQGSSKNDGAGISFAGWGYGGFGGFGYAEKEFGGLEARAIADAVTQLAYDTRGAIANEYPRVIAADGSSFTIDTAAPKEGALYLVYADGKTLRDMDGNVIAHEKNPIAVLKVTDVNVGYSTAKLADGGGGAQNIRRGDKVEPISAQKAKDMANKLPKGRPAARSSSEADLFAKGDDPGASGVPAAGKAEPEEIVAAEAPAPAEEQAKPAAVTAPAKAVEGVDPDSTTDAKLIETFPLGSTERNLVGIKHRGAYKMYSSKRYKEALEAFGSLAKDYECNYLSAYWAGMAALKLKDKTEAAEWFELALSRRPTYQPALDEKSNLGKGKK